MTIMEGGQMILGFSVEDDAHKRGAARSDLVRKGRDGGSRRESGRVPLTGGTGSLAIGRSCC